MLYHASTTGGRVLASMVYFNERKQIREAIPREIGGAFERLVTGYLVLYRITA